MKTQFVRLPVLGRTINLAHVVDILEVRQEGKFARLDVYFAISSYGPGNPRIVSITAPEDIGAIMGQAIGYSLTDYSNCERFRINAALKLLGINPPEKKAPGPGVWDPQDGPQDGPQIDPRD